MAIHAWQRLTAVCVGGMFACRHVLSSHVRHGCQQSHLRVCVKHCAYRKIPVGCLKEKLRRRGVNLHHLHELLAQCFVV